MPRYHEAIAAPRWLLGFVLLAALGTLGAAAAIATDDGLAAVGRAFLASVLALAGLAMLFVVRTFATLEVNVDDGGVSFGFRAVRKHLATTDIVSAAPDPYLWMRYGGWGVRRSTGGYRAYSQAFQRGSVVIHAADDHRYHVSSRRPDELAEAINRVAAAGTPAAETASA